jgi:hypothetical protein
MKMKRLVTAAGVAGVLCMAASNVAAQGSPGGAGAVGGGGTGSAGGQSSVGAGGTADGATGVGGAGGGMFAGRGGLGRSGGISAGSQASVAVTAVADDRANAIVVNATDETLKKIRDLVKELDIPMGEDLIYKVYRLTNADASEVSYQLSSLFENLSPSTTQTGGSGQMGGFAGSSDRLTRMSTVMSLPDPRTGALIVVASKNLLPKVEDLILQLDSDPGYKETVGFYELQNADVQDAYSILFDLFNRSTARTQNAASSSPLLGQNNPLVQRITSLGNQTSSTFGSSGTSSGRTGTTTTGN